MAGGDAHGCDGERRRGSSGEVAKRKAEEVAKPLEVEAWRVRRRDDGGGDKGGGEVLGCGDIDEGVAPEGVVGEHRLGGSTWVTERGSTRLEDDRSGGNDKMTGDGRDDRWRHLGDKKIKRKV